MLYFGPWDDPDGALKKYLEQKDALHPGRKPREDTGRLSVKELCDRYLNHKQAKLDAGEIAPRTWGNCKEAADFLVSHFGKGRLVADLDSDDFAGLRSKMTRQWGPVRVRDFVQRIRSVFMYGYDEGLMPTPMRFGKGFERPSRKSIRLTRAQQGPRTFEAAELRRMTDAAGQPMKAMILLGVNCGFGNADVGMLPSSALDQLLFSLPQDPQNHLPAFFSDSNSRQRMLRP
jgi:integrase